VRALPNLLRSRRDHADNKVSFIELFFDLVFVLAVTQLSHFLIEHFSPVGALQTFLLLLAVWVVWIYTTWVTNWLDPEKIPVRIAMFVMMGLGLVLSASLPLAFNERSLPFALAYTGLQVLRPIFFIWAVRDQPVMVRNFQRIIIWSILPAVMWITGAFLEPSARLSMWGAALALEFVGPILYFYVPGLGKSSTADWNVSGEHMAERCGLFIIIALGESILVTGDSFSHLAWDSSTVAAFLVSLLGSIIMWWIYFDDSASSGSDLIEHSDDPGRIARLSYTYLHLFIVAGIVVAAVADEFVLQHPAGHTDVKTAIAILAGNAIFLGGNLLFKATVYRSLPTSHLAGIGALGVLVPVSALLPPLGLSGCAVAVLAGVCFWERQACKACEAREAAEALKAAEG
jgi:low temperature requirement protein LtrA